MMMTEDTKTKIIHAANRLFAEKGYDGASIRDIAKAANVNVAAVNYHFTNKQGLYWHVHINSHAWLERGIAKHYEESNSTEELVLKIFNFLNEDSVYLKNTFMMFLSDSMPEADETQVEHMEQLKQYKAEFGPPGGEYLFKMITREVGEGIAPEARRWAVKALFAQVFHWALMFSTKHCQVHYKDHPDFQEEARLIYLERNVRSTLAFIISPDEVWS